jgi:hypothetical protein
MKLGRARKICGALAALALASPAPAADSSNEFLAHVLGHLYRNGESFACFSRQYDDAHLAAHPRQQMTFVKALVSAYFRQSPFVAERGSFNYQVGLAFRLRSRPETLTQVAECGAGRTRDSLRNGADCAGPGDSGSHLALKGDHILVMTIPAGADLWLPGPIDKRHNVLKNPFGPDDRAFHLERTDLAQCEDLAFDRQKPLCPHEP